MAPALHGLAAILLGDRVVLLGRSQCDEIHSVQEKSTYLFVL